MRGGEIDLMFEEEFPEILTLMKFMLSYWEMVSIYRLRFSYNHL